MEQIEAVIQPRPALGDPGLLAANWYEGRVKPAKKYRLGVIPHFLDRANPVVSCLGRVGGVKIIDVFWDVDEVLRVVQECEFIVSSSLHGLIVSDSFGVPNRRVFFPDRLIEDYKFSDYYSVFGIEEPPPLSAFELQSADLSDPSAWIGEYGRPGLSGICSELVKAFPNIR